MTYTVGLAEQKLNTLGIKVVRLFALNPFDVASDAWSLFVRHATSA
jgi:hypothetical protein